MYSKLVSFIKLRPFKFVLVIFSLLIVKELIYIQTFRNTVSPIADGYSEANTIRGGIFFHEQGLGKYSGLPDISYGETLWDKGTTANKKRENVPSVAYTHYPPGPEYMAWLGFHIFGVGNYNLLRLLPIFLSILAGLLFITTNFNLVGGGTKGVIFALLLLVPPLYSNYMHGLHHQQYAFLMLQVQMSLTILFITRKVNKILYLFFFMLLGFFQGWMTFDYAFLASLFVIPFYLYFNSSLFSLISIGLASGLGFTAAHLLHFYQVVQYYGNFEVALKDFTGAASHRAVNAATHMDIPNPKYVEKYIGPLSVAKEFLYRVAGRGKYLSINLINFIWIIIGLKFTNRITFKRGWSFEFNVSGRDLLVLLTAVVISSLWSLVMKQHAHIHGFIARHYYFCFYFCCLILVSRTRRV